MPLYYILDKKLKVTDKLEPTNERFLIVASSLDISSTQFPEGFEHLKSARIEHTRFCKADISQGMICGTFSMPKRKQNQKQVSFSFCIRENGIAFLDDTGFVVDILKSIENTSSWKKPTVGYFMASFLDAMTENDLIVIEEMEDYLSKMEASVLSDSLDGFSKKMMSIRKSILSASHYYSQMSDVAARFIQGDYLFTADEKKHFGFFYDRVKRLDNTVSVLRDYSVQISEIYQAQIDIRQNNVMKVLTVVTAVFMPLSFLAGWYGMNFKYMPELSWRYGYLVAVIIALCIIVFSIWMFRKKKYL